MEVFKQIPDANGRYSISNHGNVRKNDEIITRSNGRRQIIHARALTPILNGKGYWKVRLNVELGKVKNLAIHRLVAKCFVQGQAPGLQVNHIDGDRDNNRSSNLEWMTAKENIHHAWRIGLSSNANLQKPVMAMGREHSGVIACAKSLGVSRFDISIWCNDIGIPQFSWA